MSDPTGATGIPALERRSLPGLPDVPADQMHALLERNRDRVQQTRDELCDTSLTRRQAAERLGVPAARVDELVTGGHLVAVGCPGGLRLPAWQFDPDAPEGRLPGIGQVTAVFPGGTLGLTVWMTAANPLLSGRTPRQALLDGDVDAVVAAAEAIGT